MPLLSVAANIPLDEADELARKLSRNIASILGKPELYVMVWIQANQALSFAGNNQPAAYLELKSLGLPESETPHISEQLCALISESTGIASDRIYIEFANPPSHLWGWDRGTF